MSRSLTDRYWSKVAKTDGCWEWQAALNQAGYGLIGVEGRSTLAHRVAWTIANGPIPEGMVICHTCDNRKCVRLDHLFIGTQADNIADAVTKGRNHRGPNKDTCVNGHHLTPDNTRAFTRRGRNERACIPCAREAARRWRERNPGDSAARARQWRADRAQTTETR